MNPPLPPVPKKLEFKLSVSTEAQGRELEAASREIDRIGIKEVHHHLSGGDRERHEWRADCGIQPALYVRERQEAALAKLSEQRDLTPRKLLDRAVDDLADKYRQKSSA